MGVLYASVSRERGFAGGNGLTIRYASFRNSSIFCRARDGSMVGRPSWLLRSSLRIGVRSVMVVSRGSGRPSILKAKCQADNSQVVI